MGGTVGSSGSALDKACGMLHARLPLLASGLVVGQRGTIIVPPGLPDC